MTDLKDLAKPFPKEDIEWRVQQAGFKKNDGVYALVLAYITNRAIMQRLDDVCGVGGWKNEYDKGPSGGVICGISIKVDNEWVTKWDGADNTDLEGTKGGLSVAMKRAAVQWGMGRYLYKLEANFATATQENKYGEKDWYRGTFKKDKNSQERITFYWQHPTLPTWALPEKNNV